MNTRVVATYIRMKGMLDEDYTMYENGDIIKIYDANIYPNNQNKKIVLNAKDLQKEVKEKLLENASETDKALVRLLLEL